MAAITESARAKVNLTLNVLGRRPDGYHAIESLVAFTTSLCDVIRLTPDSAPQLQTSGPFAAAIHGENLIAKALAQLAKTEPRLALGSITLEKNLPVAAGLGGGSADAAAVLRAVRQANAARADRFDWPAMAAALGADVPVCLASTPAFMWGVGEKMVAVPDLPRLSAVLVNPLAAVPTDKTAQVFSQLAAQPIDRADDVPCAPGRFHDAAALIAYMAAQGNDLLPAAIDIVPEIAAVRVAITAAPGCRYTSLSGAGPTCFGIFDSVEQAASAEVSLRKSQPNWWVAASELGG